MPLFHSAKLGCGWKLSTALLSIGGCTNGRFFGLLRSNSVLLTTVKALPVLTQFKHWPCVAFTVFWQSFDPVRNPSLRHSTASYRPSNDPAPFDSTQLPFQSSPFCMGFEATLACRWPPNSNLPLSLSVFWSLQQRFANIFRQSSIAEYFVSSAGTDSSMHASPYEHEGLRDVMWGQSNVCSPHFSPTGPPFEFPTFQGICINGDGKLWSDVSSSGGCRLNNYQKRPARPKTVTNSTDGTGTLQIS